MREELSLFVTFQCLFTQGRLLHGRKSLFTAVFETIKMACEKLCDRIVAFCKAKGSYEFKPCTVKAKKYIIKEKSKKCSLNLMERSHLSKNSADRRKAASSLEDFSFCLLVSVVLEIDHDM